MLETMRDLVVLEGLKMKYETKIRVVVDAIGGESCDGFNNCTTRLEGSPAFA